MSKNLFDISGKVVAITGAYGVLGTSISKYLATQGCKVVLLGRAKNKGEELLAAIRADGGEALFLECDVLNQKCLEANCADILKAYGRIDVLLNAAGGNMPGATVPPDKTIFDLNLDDFKKVVDLNFLGTVMPTLVFAKAMVAQGAGNIINFSSESALRPVTRVAGYGAAKAAVTGFTKYLAGEFSKKYKGNYRVNALVPGFFVTNQNHALLINADGSYTDRAKSILAHTPFGRFGEADELLGSVHYLISDASSFVTGTLLVVDGGFDAFTV
jgi:NAD(P)-dependent dehydrogenase (short-subunit alcohol dehydrogenase family)